MRTSSVFRVLIVAVVLLAGGLTFANQEAIGNQQGPGVGDRTENMIGLCGLNGGGVSVDVAGDRTVDSYHSWTKVTCVGGYLDGLTCTFTASGTVCDWSKVGMAPSPGGGLHDITVANQDLTFVSDLPVVAAVPLTADVASEPMLVEAVVTWNSSDEALTEAGIEQVNACRLLGGTELVTHADGDPQSASFTVQCEGGLLDGQWCAFGTGSSTCFFLPESTPTQITDAMPTVTTVPTSTDDMNPATEPTIAATAPPPTVTAPTATVAPTDVPVIEPTAPAVEPTLPMFEQDPTPTEAPLR